MTLTVADDGRGLAGTSPGVGTRSMHALAQRAGGTVRLQPRASGGALVLLQLPKEEESAG